MLSNLQCEIELLQKRMECRSQQITTLFIDLDEIQVLFKTNITVLNCFETLSVDILQIIFDYLDLKTILGFRLINKSGNQITIFILQRKVKYLKINKDKLILDIENLKRDNIVQFEQQDINLLIQQYQESLDALRCLFLSEICEFKAMCNPPEIFIKIFGLLGILLNGKQPQSWRHSLQIIRNAGEFIKTLIEFDISSITDKQLILLQEIYVIHEQSVFIAKIITTFYKYLKLIVQLRESQQFHILHKLNQKQRLSKELDKQIQRFQKIIK